MFAFLQRLFDTRDFPARWTCGRWSPEHGWLHILSDIAIFGAYAAIPLALAYFIRRRKDVPFIPIFWLFAVFIFSCGFGHLVEASIFWHPWYRFSGGVKLVTAVVSWLTVFALVKVLPSALALPGLAKVNRQLEAEMAERERAEARVKQSEERFRSLVEAAPNAMLMVSQSGTIELVNAQSEALFGYARAELLGQPVELLVPQRYRAAHAGHRTGFFAHPSARAMGAGRDLFGLRKDGREVPIEIGLNPIRAPEGAFVLASIIDITGRKRHEDQIEASLHEKEILLKEIHHRVKNNLQVISSILQMQSRAIDDPHYRAIFGECQDRVRTMALVHERLYRSPSLASIDLGEELRELASMLTTSYGRPGVRLTVEVEETPVNIENAVPLGLVLNELVSNALKHAFPEDRGGTVTVTLARPTPDHLRLSVRDDGRGLPEGFAWDKTKSLGLTMVNALARQLRATVDVRQKGGTEFVLTFPAPALAP